MKYATLLCLASILAVCFTACSLFSQPEDELSQQERLLVGPTWKLVAIFDTYDELWHEAKNRDQVCRSVLERVIGYRVACLLARNCPLTYEPKQKSSNLYATRYRELRRIRFLRSDRFLSYPTLSQNRFMVSSKENASQRKSNPPPKIILQLSGPGLFQYGMKTGKNNGRGREMLLTLIAKDQPFYIGADGGLRSTAAGLAYSIRISGLTRRMRSGQ